MNSIYYENEISISGPGLKGGSPGPEADEHRQHWQEPGPREGAVFFRLIVIERQMS
jgi:hypothetical protein